MRISCTGSAGFHRAPRPALYSISETEIILDASHATVYRLIAAGRLVALKLGGRTKITAESIEALIASLPAADIRPAQRAG